MNRASRTQSTDEISTPSISNPALPLLVGDAIHILNRQVHKAMITKDEEILTGLVRKQVAAGAQALAVNLGPGREMGRLTPWVVRTIRRHTDLPLYFSANILAHKQLLQEYGHGIVINAVTAGPEELAGAMTTAGEHGCSLVVLLVRPGTVISSIDDRIRLAALVLEEAAQSGFAPSRLYLDPVMTCRPDPAAWHVSRGLPDVTSVVETIGWIRQLDQSVKTIVAAGNGTEGMAREQRDAFQVRMLLLFAEAGLDAVLLNCSGGNVPGLADLIAGSAATYRGGQACAIV